MELRGRYANLLRYGLIGFDGKETSVNCLEDKNEKGARGWGERKKNKQIPPSPELRIPGYATHYVSLLWGSISPSFELVVSSSR